MSTVIAGGGVIGLAAAWRLATAGADVTVVDPAPGEAASYAAAGLLSPVFEVQPGEEPLLELNLDSYRRWSTFAAELVDATGIDLQLRTEGTLGVAFDADDLRALEALRRIQESLALPVTALPSRGCRELEPMLSPRVRGGVRVDAEWSVDPRAVCRALLAAGEACGVTVVRARLGEVAVTHGRAVGVRLEDGTSIAADQVVVALGAWSGGWPGLPAEARPPVRPVKGQILRLRFDPDDPPLRRTVHGMARGREIYLVPRTDGELVVGATVEDAGFDTTVTAGAVHELLAAAIDVLPIVGELELVEAIARPRPGTVDNAPVIGATPVDGLLLATGHFRNGVLLAPVTADAVRSLVVDGKLPAACEPFTIGRFAS